VAGIGWWINNLQSPAEMVAVVSEDQVLRDTLSDGSTIDLNKKSSLSYSSDFGKKNRRVQLKGEAFFNVRHDDALPFIVESKGVLIEDIGTAFNVFAPEDSSIVRVSVEEGTVHFFVEGSEGVMLEKGQAAEYNSATGVITRLANINPAESAYRNGVLRFNNAHLSEVAVALQKLYDVPVVMEPGLEDCLITVTFTNESLDTVLNIIAETLNLQYVREENRILLKGSGCGN
jgi:ferric-dicitrate binding protein FerR (iron transport regulator)